MLRGAVLIVAGILAFPFGFLAHPKVPVVDRAYAADCTQIGNFNSGSSSVIKSAKMTDLKNVSNGVKTDFSIEFSGPLVADGASLNLLYVRIFRNDGNGWKSVAGTVGQNKGTSDPVKIDVLNVNGRDRTAVGSHTDKGVTAGTSYRYQIWAVETANIQNPNCSDPFSITFRSGGTNEEAVTPPCPTNVRPIKAVELPDGVSVDFNHLYFKWDFSWDEQPANSNIIYVLKYLKPDGAPDNGKEFTINEGLIQLYGASSVPQINNEVVFDAKDTVSSLTSKNCKGVKIESDSTAGITKWIGQDGTSHSASPGEYSREIGSESDQNGCNVSWIVTGDGNLLNPFDDGAPDVLTNLNINGKQLNPFSRLSVCLYLWTIYPVTIWASGLIEDVGGIAYQTPKVKWHA